MHNRLDRPPTLPPDAHRPHQTRPSRGRLRICQPAPARASTVRSDPLMHNRLDRPPTLPPDAHRPHQTPPDLPSACPQCTRSKVSDKSLVMATGYGPAMVWSAEARGEQEPKVQLGWEIVGRMVKRRRRILRWSQRDLSRACGLAQSTICRLESGTLSGVRFSRFARLVAALGGLDPDAPHPPMPPWYHDGWD